MRIEVSRYYAYLVYRQEQFDDTVVKVVWFGVGIGENSLSLSVYINAAVLKATQDNFGSLII